MRIQHTPLPPEVPLPRPPQPGDPGTLSATITWPGASASHGQPGVSPATLDFGSSCVVTIQTPFYYYGYAFSEEATSCTADITLIEDSMLLFRNGDEVASNTNAVAGQAEADDVLYACVNNYHTWQALADVYALSSSLGWGHATLASFSNYIYC